MRSIEDSFTAYPDHIWRENQCVPTTRPDYSTPHLLRELRDIDIYVKTQMSDLHRRMAALELLIKERGVQA
jgi:hypothetical protein